MRSAATSAPTFVSFCIGDNDYLDPVNMASANDSSSGGMRLNRSAVDRSSGYFATAMGMRETAPRTADMVMWNSSAQRMLGGEALMGFLPPAEVNRLVSERIVMRRPAQQTA
ncbi:MAG: hypothetical protein IPI14_00030 [Polaromonas sp.]|nr:hypothetical protein [Polaromonas sp.]